MKPFKYERLFRALLLEAVSGFYREGQRFLSYRKVCRIWNVSQATAEAALLAMVESGLLAIRPRSGYRLEPGFRRGALRLLSAVPEAAAPTPPLPLRPNWVSRRAHLLEPANERPRVAVVFDVKYRRTLVSARTPDFLGLGSTLDCARGCEASARANGCDLIFFALKAEGEPFEALVRWVRAQECRGVIFLRRREAPLYGANLLRFQEERLPVLSVFDACGGTEAFVLDYNHFGAGDRAASIFLATGAQRLMVVRPGVEQNNFTERVEGFLQRVAREGQREGNPASADVLRLSPFSPISERLQQWLREGRGRRSGLYLTAHYPLERWMPVLRRLRLRVPEDVSLLMTSSHSVFPGVPQEFDLLRFDFEAIGARAVELMAAVLRGEAVPKTTLLDLPYVAHGSVARSEQFNTQH